MASPDLVTLGLSLLKGTIEDQAYELALEGNIQTVTVICFGFQSKQAMKQWISLPFGNEDEELISSDEAVNFVDVKPE